MNFGRLLKTAVAVGVVVNVYDYLVHGLLLGGSYAEIPILIQDASMVPFIVGDFVAALIFVWVFDKVRASFGAGMMGGLTFGFYAGILIAFPMYIFLHLIIAGFTYWLSWVWIITGIGGALAAGATAGAVYGGDEATG